jgi:hypothetical protein
MVFEPWYLNMLGTMATGKFVFKEISIFRKKNKWT